jgi:uncharacterized membrane protein YbhN (UPF0104 family)
LSHVLALALLALDLLARAWRIQITTWAAGGRLPFRNAIALNAYGEAAAILTPYRLGGEPARFLGLVQAGVRPVPALVSIGVEVAGEWPAIALLIAGTFWYFGKDWVNAITAWFAAHPITGLAIAAGAIAFLFVARWIARRRGRVFGLRHRVIRQWRVALAHVRRSPWWVVLSSALLTLVSVGARAAILPVLLLGIPGRPPLLDMFFGAVAMLHAPLVLPIPAGAGGVELAFFAGIAGAFDPARRVEFLLLWRFYTVGVVTALGVYLLVRTTGWKAAFDLLRGIYRPASRVPPGGAKGG